MFPKLLSICITALIGCTALSAQSANTTSSEINNIPTTADWGYDDYAGYAFTIGAAEGLTLSLIGLKLHQHIFGTLPSGFFAPPGKLSKWTKWERAMGTSMVTFMGGCVGYLWSYPFWQADIDYGVKLFLGGLMSGITLFAPTAWYFYKTVHPPGGYQRTRRSTGSADGL